MKPVNNLLLCTAVLMLAGLSGCTQENVTAAKNAKDVKKEEHSAKAPVNRLDIPPLVRKNLGITFATASYGSIENNIRVPGSFELLPSAQFHYPLPLAGRITIHVKPLQQIQQGSLLMEIDAPEWRKLQATLSDAQAAIIQADADITKARVIMEAAAQLTTRPAQTQQEPDANRAAYNAALATKQAAVARFKHLLAEASSITGLPAASLEEEQNKQALWQRLQTIPVRASHPAVVQEINSSTGAWQEQGDEIIHAIQPQALRFHGRALQADLKHLRDGQHVRMYPPGGHSDSQHMMVSGSLRVGISGDAEKRLIDVFVDLESSAVSPWLRPQVAAIAEITTAGSKDNEELLIPVRAVISDGLEKILFRRNPRNPDQVIRIVADLGVSDGHRVAVHSGLAENDEVVVDGIYELKLELQSKRGGNTQPKGHMHADGTWHEGEH